MAGVSDTTAKAKAKAASNQTVAQIIAEVANQYGIPPSVALAIASQESGLRANAVGDQGTSFGVYQLHEGGELGDHDEAWADNVRNNAETALREVAEVRANEPAASWGKVAADAQRPQDRAGYAASVNGILGTYQSSGSSNAVKYFEDNSRAGATLATDEGGDAGGGVPASLTAQNPETVGQYLDNPDIESTYGYLAAYLKNPEVGPILAKAAKNGWGQDELLGALEKTSWWKKTSDSARSWQAQQRLDPATARQRLNQMSQQIQQLAQSTLGAKLNPKRVTDMANAAIASDWSDAQLQAAVGAEFKYQGQNAKYIGAAGQTITGLQKLAGEYAVPISNSTMKNWTKSVLEGNNTTQDFQSYLQAQAESLYPTLAAPLKSGNVTVQDYFSPYAQLASQILEKPVDSIDVMNPKWNKALNTVQPDGTRAPMTLSDWSTYLRGLPEFQQTEQAKSSAADFAVNLGNIFGKISTPTTTGATLSSSGS